MEEQTVSSMCYFKCQRVTRVLTILNFLCERQKPLLFLVFLHSCPFLSSRFISGPRPILPVPLLQPQIIHLSVSVIPHTHQRSNFITHHSWRPLSTSVYVGETECVWVCFCAVSHYAVHDIIKRGNISPLKSFSSLCCLLQIVLFVLRMRRAEPAYLLPHKCVCECFCVCSDKDRKIQTSAYCIIWSHTSLLCAFAFLHFPLSVKTKTLLLLRIQPNENR